MNQFERDESILNRRTDLLSHRTKSMSEERKAPVITFLIGLNRYGIRVSELLGIRKMVNVTTILGSDERTVGLMTVQGEVFTLFQLTPDSDFRKSTPKQGLSPANLALDFSAEPSLGYALLLNSIDHQRFGLCVHALGLLVQVDEKLIRNQSPVTSDLNIESRYVHRERDPFLLLSASSILKNYANKGKSV